MLKRCCMRSGCISTSCKIYWQVFSRNERIKINQEVSFRKLPGIQTQKIKMNGPVYFVVTARWCYIVPLLFFFLFCIFTSRLQVD
ncbi:MAG: hypothetical protein JWP81_2010 [Ferruginibacter sp.]|nr:hypothetical protein [Ferruginibacter sp.]